MLYGNVPLVPQTARFLVLELRSNHAQFDGLAGFLGSAEVDQRVFSMMKRGRRFVSM